MFQRNFLIPKKSRLAGEYPAVPPVEPAAARPYWSVMIPTYNRPDYLRETLLSILKQAPPAREMQIMVVDNGSTTGDTQILVDELGTGRIEYHRHPQNIPLTANWTSCLQLARGWFVHIMHDDDILQPGFYAANREHIETYNCDIMFSQSAMIDDQRRWLALTDLVPTADGIVTDPIRIILNPRTFTLNSMIAARNLYEQIGGFHPALHFGCDHELCSRLFKIGKVGYLAQPLVLTREHPGRDSTAAWIKPETVEQYLTAYQMALNGWDTPQNRALLYTIFSSVLQNISLSLLNQGHFRVAFRIAVWSFRTAPSESSFAHIIYVFRRWLFSSRLKSLIRAIRRIFNPG